MGCPCLGQGFYYFCYIYKPGFYDLFKVWTDCKSSVCLFTALSPPETSNTKSIEQHNLFQMIRRLQFRYQLNLGFRLHLHFLFLLPGFPLTLKD
ncbi:hypothetical protein EUGRSUZ_G02592 [Eucalyptus grandis]|uniref:Uncharacterized protein n=2 Tax=Eucalyptus grandis TaxID=71139 RepID=A0ACC3K728_EUCGR|nr:hypothetical protein EUGRSUZ_G02592 [Eucalyptus grandis]